MLPKNINFEELEEKWYTHWMDKDYFASIPDEREPYTIVIPPPNVTGVLHMGHMLNNTIQDVLIRKARMSGYNACWVPGTDHASIATEAKVVAKLKEEGINKYEIGREKFLEHAFEWKDKYGGIILDQLKKLGASCDWNRTRFTMEENLSKAVVKSFVQLHDKGYIYKGLRMTNWDPEAKTALSNEEVNHKEVNSKLYYVKYQVSDSEDFITIATTRPETILGDTAICVNPNDDRYKHLKGQKVIIPMVDRIVPIIFDDYVDMEFGTGALKVTPAHDENDYELGVKHHLDTIDILNDDGTMSELAQFYIGEDRFVVRKKIAKELEVLGILLKVEEIKNKVGYSERTGAVIEPRLTKQWFLKMEELAKPALENVMNDSIQFYPSKFKNLYKNWLDNIRDWCISRQLWWGQQIPAFYFGNGEDEFVVAETKEKAIEKIKEKYKFDLAAFELAYQRGNITKEEFDNAKENTKFLSLEPQDLKQDVDVVDTWFSSWLWPISVFDGFENKEEVDYYYPTTVLVTGWDIIFFWVARMIFAGYEFRNEKPFKSVYFTGMVRDKQRRKMSKSLGNSPDTMELIKKFGADGVRSGVLLCAAAGNDLLFDEKLCEQGRNFSNKIWNALRLIKGWELDQADTAKNEKVLLWMDSKLNQTIERVEKSYEDYRLSEALMTLYNFVWTDFCSWYLEFIKPDKGGSIDKVTFNKTIFFFKKIMKLLHPFMPFITEEVFSHIKDKEEKDIIISDYPQPTAYETTDIINGEHIKEVISAIRDIRNQHGVKMANSITVSIKTNNKLVYNGFDQILTKMCNLNGCSFVEDDVVNTSAVRVGKDQLFIDLGIEVDVASEKAKIQEEIHYLEGFLVAVNKKLSNERFVNNAPEMVVKKERQKQEDALQKIELLKASLENLN